MDLNLPVSVLIPVKDDEENLSTCLQQLNDFDDIHVVDSQSGDGTAELCKKAGVHHVQFEWNGQYPKKRNWALGTQNFKYDWILLLDADERVNSAFVSELRTIMISSSHDAYWISYQNFFMNIKIRGDRFSKIALIRKGKVFYERVNESEWSHLDMEVHEHPIVPGSIGTMKTPLDHFDFRGLQKYMEKHLQYASWEAHRFTSGFDLSHAKTIRQKIKYRLLDTWIWGPMVFMYLFFVRAGFLDGKVGAIFALQKCVYFWNIKMRIEDIRFKNNQSMRKNE